MEAPIIEIVCSQKRCRIRAHSARPLIGFDKADAIALAREIGTFDESTSRATGCKAVPKGPSTKAHLAEILEMERNMEATKMPLPV